MLNRRFLWAFGLLTVTGLTQMTVERHLSAVAAPVSVELREELSGLPMQIGEWKGSDREIDNPNALYGDDHLQREYRNGRTGQRVMIWVAYSKVGKDRAHHPEICMAVAGQPEQQEFREQVDMGDGGEAIQQFSFGSPGSQQWVYYWYYSLPTLGSDSKVSSLQKKFQTWRFRPSSVTVEVFVPKNRRQDLSGAQTFVKELNVAMQTLVGKEAKRGSERIPVTRIDG